MAQSSEPNLINFFIFNSIFGPKEGEEHKKILFYYPGAVDIDTKIKQVGLCEAIVKFTQTFTDKPCEALHTQKTRQIFYEPECNFWMVMTVSVPFSQKTRDGQTFLEYHEDYVQDSVYEAVLQQAYAMFKLFNGSLHSIMDRGSVLGLKQKLDFFFSKYLLTLKLNQADILDVFNGIQFLPLDKNTFLRIQCFINLLEAAFDVIQYTAFLYNDQLVWSGLEQDDMRILYRYLTTSLFPGQLEQEFLQTSSAPPASLSHSPATGSTRFILGAPNLNDDTNLGKIPRVFVNVETEQQECHLVVYRALSANLCLLLKGSTTLSIEHFRKLNQFLSEKMGGLASDISDQYASSKRSNSSTETVFRYVYFNHMNLAQKTTVHSDGRKSGSLTIQPEILRVLADLNYDLNRVTTVEDGETIIKTASDCWVVGKKSDQREFYVVLNQKNANLIEINDEVKKLCASHFSNIFFLD